MAEIERCGTVYRTRTQRETLILTEFCQGAETGFGIWYDGQEEDPDKVLVVFTGSLAEAVGELVAIALYEPTFRTETAVGPIGAIATVATAIA